MLDQNFGLNESYQACDTTTGSTPFSVKDILNISNESEFINNNNQTKDYYNYYDNYGQYYYQNWDSNYMSPYEHYNNCNMQNYVEIKVENDCNKLSAVTFDNQHMQNLHNYCTIYQDPFKDPLDYQRGDQKLESSSKCCLLKFFVTF